MATRSTTYNPAITTEDRGDTLENRRMLSRLNDQEINGVRFYGEMDETRGGAAEYIADYHLPDGLVATDIRGVGAESQVNTEVAHGEQIKNQMQTTVERASVKLAAMRRKVIGDLGSLDVQGMELRKRVYRIINAVIIGNQAGRAAAEVTTNGVRNDTGADAASAMTYLGDSASNAVDASNNRSILNAAGSNLVLTDSGGYTGSTGTTAAIDDDTVDSNRVSLTFRHLFQAVARIYERTHGHSGSTMKGGMSGRPDFVAFVPASLVEGLMTSVQSNSIQSLNRYTSRIGGSNMEIQTNVSVINTTFGRIAIMVTAENLGGGSNNKIVLVSTKDATKVVYNTRPNIYDTRRLTSERETSCNAVFTIYPPKQETGVAIVGLNQS